MWLTTTNNAASWVASIILTDGLIIDPVEWEERYGELLERAADEQRRYEE